MEDYDGIVLAMAHKKFKDFEDSLKQIKNKKIIVVYNIKSCL